MKIIITILIIIAILGLTWFVFSFVKLQDKEVENATENFTEFISREPLDPCETPAEYTAEEWREHMSHHPDRYVDCLSYQ